MRKGWQALPFGEIATFESARHDGSHRPFIGLEHIEPHSGRLVADARCSKVQSATFAFGPEHVLYGRLRPYLNKVHLPDFEGHCSTEIYPILPARGLDRRYLFYWLTSPATVEAINATCTGARMPRANLSDIEQLIIPVPSATEQKQIVALLDEAFEAIAIAEANTKLACSRLQSLRSEKLKSLFADHPNVPKKTLSSVSRLFSRGRSKHRPRNDPALYGGETPFIQTGEIRNARKWVETFGETYSPFGVKQSRLWPAGTLCITIAANIAETAILSFDACFPDSVIGLIVDENQALNEYLLLALEIAKAELQSAGTGSAQDNINLATFEHWLFPIPPMDVQEKIVSELNIMDAELLISAESYSRKLDLLKELKTALLARAFSGELIAAEAPSLTVGPANDNDYTTLEQVANVIAFVQRQHITQRQQLTFGHKKAQKALQLIEAVEGVELGRRPKKDAAGPNDFPHMLAAERWAKANSFFEFVKEDGRYTFIKLAKYAERMQAADAALSPIKDRLERATALVVELDSKKAEVLATVHAAWNNLILDDEDLTEEAIIRAAREEWHPDKLLIPTSEFRLAFREIVRLGIVPDGSAKRVGEPRLL